MTQELGGSNSHTHSTLASEQKGVQGNIKFRALQKDQLQKEHVQIVYINPLPLKQVISSNGTNSSVIQTQIIFEFERLWGSHFQFIPFIFLMRSCLLRLLAPNQLYNNNNEGYYPKKIVDTLIKSLLADPSIRAELIFRKKQIYKKNTNKILRKQKSITRNNQMSQSFAYQIIDGKEMINQQSLLDVIRTNQIEEVLLESIMKSIIRKSIYEIPLSQNLKSTQSLVSNTSQIQVANNHSSSAAPKSASSTLAAAAALITSHNRTSHSLQTVLQPSQIVTTTSLINTETENKIEIQADQRVINQSEQVKESNKNNYKGNELDLIATKGRPIQMIKKEIFNSIYTNDENDQINQIQFKIKQLELNNNNQILSSTNFLQFKKFILVPLTDIKLLKSMDQRNQLGKLLHYSLMVLFENQIFKVQKEQKQFFQRLNLLKNQSKFKLAIKVAYQMWESERNIRNDQKANEKQKIGKIGEIKQNKQFECIVIVKRFDIQQSNKVNIYNNMIQQRRQYNKNNQINYINKDDINGGVIQKDYRDEDENENSNNSQQKQSQLNEYENQSNESQIRREIDSDNENDEENENQQERQSQLDESTLFSEEGEYSVLNNNSNKQQLNSDMQDDAVFSCYITPLFTNSIEITQNEEQFIRNGIQQSSENNNKVSQSQSGIQPQETTIKKFPLIVFHSMQIISTLESNREVEAAIRVAVMDCGPFASNKHSIDSFQFNSLISDQQQQQYSQQAFHIQTSSHYQYSLIPIPVPEVPTFRITYVNALDGEDDMINYCNRKNEQQLMDNNSIQQQQQYKSFITNSFHKQSLHPHLNNSSHLPIQNIIQPPYLTHSIKNQQQLSQKQSIESLFALWCLCIGTGMQNIEQQISRRFLLGVARGCANCSLLPMITEYISQQEKENNIDEKETQGNNNQEINQNNKSKEIQVDTYNKMCNVDFPFILIPDSVGSFLMRLLSKQAYHNLLHCQNNDIRQQLNENKMENQLEMQKEEVIFKQKDENLNEKSNSQLEIEKKQQISQMKFDTLSENQQINDKEQSSEKQQENINIQSQPNFTQFPTSISQLQPIQYNPQFPLVSSTLHNNYFQIDSLDSIGNADGIESEMKTMEERRMNNLDRMSMNIDMNTENQDRNRQQISDYQQINTENTLQISPNIIQQQNTNFNQSQQPTNTINSNNNNNLINKPIIDQSPLTSEQLNELKSRLSKRFMEISVADAREWHTGIICEQRLFNAQKEQQKASDRIWKKEKKDWRRKVLMNFGEKRISQLRRRKNKNKNEGSKDDITIQKDKQMFDSEDESDEMSYSIISKDTKETVKYSNSMNKDKYNKHKRRGSFDKLMREANQVKKQKRKQEFWEQKSKIFNKQMEIRQKVNQERLEYDNQFCFDEQMSNMEYDDDNISERKRYSLSQSSHQYQSQIMASQRSISVESKNMPPPMFHSHGSGQYNIGQHYYSQQQQQQQYKLFSPSTRTSPSFTPRNTFFSPTLSSNTAFAGLPSQIWSIRTPHAPEALSSQSQSKEYQSNKKRNYISPQPGRAGSVGSQGSQSSSESYLGMGSNRIGRNSSSNPFANIGAVVGKRQGEIIGSIQFTPKMNRQLPQSQHLPHPVNAQQQQILQQQRQQQQQLLELRANAHMTNASHITKGQQPQNTNQSQQSQRAKSVENYEAKRGSEIKLDGLQNMNQQKNNLNNEFESKINNTTNKQNIQINQINNQPNQNNDQQRRRIKDSDNQQQQDEEDNNILQEQEEQLAQEAETALRISVGRELALFVYRTAISRKIDNKEYYANVSTISGAQSQSARDLAEKSNMLLQMSLQSWGPSISAFTLKLMKGEINNQSSRLPQLAQQQQNQDNSSQQNQMIPLSNLSDIFAASICDLIVGLIIFTSQADLSVIINPQPTNQNQNSSAQIDNKNTNQNHLFDHLLLWSGQRLEKPSKHKKQQKQIALSIPEPITIDQFETSISALDEVAEYVLESASVAGHTSVEDIFMRRIVAMEIALASEAYSQTQWIPPSLAQYITSKQMHNIEEKNVQSSKQNKQNAESTAKIPSQMLVQLQKTFSTISFCAASDQSGVMQPKLELAMRQMYSRFSNIFPTALGVITGQEQIDESEEDDDEEEDEQAIEDSTDGNSIEVTSESGMHESQVVSSAMDKDRNIGMDSTDEEKEDEETRRRKEIEQRSALLLNKSKQIAKKQKKRR